MFGLTVEKLFVVAVLAAIIIGPRRLPEYTARLVGLIRRIAGSAAATRSRVVEEADAVDWRALDPRQYDPRRIIREAWADAAEAERSPAGDTAGDSAGDRKPEGRWVITGSSAHPRREWATVED